MPATGFHTIEYWLDDVRAWLTVPDDPETDYLVLDILLTAESTQSVVLDVLMQPKGLSGFADGPLILLESQPLRLMSRTGTGQSDARAVLSHLSRDRISEWYFRLRVACDGETLGPDGPKLRREATFLAGG